MENNRYNGFALRYRPQTFTDVIAQQSVTNTLINTINSGKISHAYLFCGPKGTGKTTCARIFAKAINCFNPQNGNPCNKCEACVGFNNIYELDAASNNSVEDIREIVEQVRYMPSYNTYSVYIIDEVHMLSQAAFNAFLKTLEEPPTHVVFILATTEKNKLLTTVTSRCQIYDFKPIKTEDIITRLKFVLQQEYIDFEEEALYIIANEADGAMRDALIMLETIINYDKNKVTVSSTTAVLNIIDDQTYNTFVNTIGTCNVHDIILEFNKVICQGYDPLQFIYGLMQYLRGLLLMTDPRTRVLLNKSDVIKQKYYINNTFSEDDIIQILSMIDSWSLSYRNQINKNFYTEILFLRIVDKMKKKQ